MQEINGVVMYTPGKFPSRGSLGMGVQTQSATIAMVSGLAGLYILPHSMLNEEHVSDVTAAVFFIVTCCDLFYVRQSG